MLLLNDVISSLAHVQLYSGAGGQFLMAVKAVATGQLSW